ncbi:MAG TPA: M36 family metallopeptidase [Baekduia sp.]
MLRWPIREVLVACALCVASSSLAATAATAADTGLTEYDARSGDRAAVGDATADARVALGKRLGPQSTVSTDPETGGLRDVGRADGFLTDPSGADPAAIALGYVRDHAAAYGLDGQDLAQLRLERRTTTSDGMTHLAFAQVAGGIPAYDSALTANVTADGRLVNTTGAPVHDLAPPGATPPLGPAAARAAAQRDLGVRVDGDPGVTRGGDPTRSTTFAGGDTAALVTLADPDGDRLAWKLVVAGVAPYVYEVLVDAATGAVLTRHSLTDTLASNATVQELHPGDGTLATRDIGPWLSSPANSLSGPDVHAYADRSAPDGIGGDVEVPRSGGNDFTYTTTPLVPAAGQTCPTRFGGVCTWDGATLSSAAANVNQVTTQVFYAANRFHDWLAQPPIDFTAASGAFEGDDPLLAETDDYSSFNNSNMTVKPDGQSPVMQMYLFKAPFPAVSGGDDATIVYHEYTHGLTARLVGGDGKANGLFARQSQALSEGWSDFYALDYLTDQGLLVDDPAHAGDELIGAYVTNDTDTGIRDNAVDCPVGSADATHCPGAAGSGAGTGGFTFGDLGRVDAYGADHPRFEPHADGEIWSETLWDLRQKLGADVARALVTSALRLSPKDPSFLDMRDKILQADTAADGGAHSAAIWQVFAHRGMGSRAVTTPNSTHAVDAFDTPPVATPGAPSVAAAPLDQDTAFTVPVANAGGSALTGVRATLTSATGGVTVVQGAASLGTIAAHGSAGAPFTIHVDPAVGCAAIAATTLTITADQGTQSFPISLPIGSGTGVSTRSYTTPAAIPDNAPSGGLTSTLNVPTHGRVGTGMRVLLTAAHTWIGDLHAWLTSPSGTTVDLMERPGVDTQHFYSGGKLVASAPLVFDDAGASEIQELATVAGTVSGPWRPNGALSAFAAEDRFGTWTLHVTDGGQGDVGSLSSWSIQTSDPTCAVTDAPDDLYEDHATFHARVDPGAASGTAAAFELGSTAAYGARSPATTVTGAGLQDFTVSTGGLTAGQTYHVRAIVLRGGAIVATGADRTFVAGSQPGTQSGGGGRDGNGTGGGGAGGGGPGSDSGPGGGGSGPGTGETGGAGSRQTFTVPKATMKSLTRSLRLDRKGRFTLTFRATPAKAKGTIKVLLGKATAGSGKFTVPSSGRVKITIKATKKLLAAVRKGHTAKARATLKIGVTSFTATLTIKPYKKPASGH